jgi:hypothetical protein
MGTCWECCWHNGSGTHPPFPVISELPQKFLGNFVNSKKKFKKFSNARNFFLEKIQTMNIGRKNEKT